MNRAASNRNGDPHTTARRGPLRSIAVRAVIDGESRDLAAVEYDEVRRERFPCEVTGQMVEEDVAVHVTEVLDPTPLHSGDSVSFTTTLRLT